MKRDGQNFKRKLGLQSLEDRRLLAADVGFSDGFIQILGSEADDAVESYREGDSIVVTVSDEGPGILEEDQKQLFTLFYRTPGALDSSVPGTGIGLYVSKQIVGLHGGKISLSSVPGEGTSVSVRLFGARREQSEDSGLGRQFWNALQDLDEAV